MRIPEKTLEEWLDKLRTPELQYRECWRLFDKEDYRSRYLRYRNTVTDQFHYNPVGLLLRTKKGKTLGKYIEYELDSLSVFKFKGLQYPVTSCPGPKILKEKFNFTFLDTREALIIDSSIYSNRTFEQYADWLEDKYGNKITPTHSNPLLVF